MGAWWRRALATLGTVAAALLVAVVPANAHADLVGSTPPDGARLLTEPDRVVLLFSEEVTSRLSSVKVIAPDGQRVDDGPAAPDAGRETTLAVRLRPDAAHGTYVLTWRAVAADDGHATAGGLTFAVGAPSVLPANLVTGASSTPVASTVALDVAIWLGFLGFALLAGFLVVRLGCAPAGSRVPSWPATTGWLVLFGASVAQLLLYGAYAAGLGPTHVFDSGLVASTLSVRLGQVLLVRAGALVALAVLGDWLVARTRWWSATALAGLVLALAATWGVTSHGADGPAAAVAVSVTTLHVAAMGVWAGGLLSVLTLLRPTPPQPRAPEPAGGGVAVAVAAPSRAAVQVAVARFSRVALASVLVLAGTGLFQAVREIGGFGALVGSGYGRLLVAKLGVLAVVLVVASRSRRAVAARLPGGTAGLRRTVAVEMAGLVVLLVITTLLIGSPPPHPPA